MLRFVALKYGTQVLTNFTETFGTVHYRNTTISKPDPQSLVNLFLINLVVTAVELLKEYEGLSADSLDFLAVSGLVHFPLTEGGPINYMKRNGLTSLNAKLQEAISKNTSNKQLQNLIRSLMNSLESMDEEETGKYGLSLLTDRELRLIGPTLGAQHISSILYPFPFNARPLYLMLFFLLFPIVWLVVPVSLSTLGIVTLITLIVLIFI